MINGSHGVRVYGKYLSGDANIPMTHGCGDVQVS